MNLSVNCIERIISRLFKLYDIENLITTIVSVKPIGNNGDKDNFYGSITFVFNNESKFLLNNKSSEYKRELFRAEQFSKLTKDLLDFSNINLIITTSGFQSESYYKQLNFKLHE